MARPRRKSPLLAIARSYISAHMPELRDAPLHIRQLDGPPGAPRFAVTIEHCAPAQCPHGVPRNVAAAGGCPVRACPLRRSVRILMNRDGTIVQVTQSRLHWSRS